MGMNEGLIAFVTEDGSTISPHFGRAQYYEIATLRNGQPIDRQRVNKAGHHTFSPEGHLHGGDGHEHHQTERHMTMTAPLAGVEALVARGMGMGAYQHLLSSGIRPILTDLATIDEAIAHYVAGTLQDNPRRLHHHGPRRNT